ncbi:MAG: hypothetical protein ACX94A_03235 [Algiphilus sp.]
MSYPRETKEAIFQALNAERQRETLETGAFSGWGHKRLKGREGEFGLTASQLAEALVDVAIDNRRGHLGRDAVVLHRITELAGAVSLSGERVNVAHLPAEVIDTLTREAASDALAWDACARLFDDTATLGTPVPAALLQWAGKALTGEAERPAGKTGPDSADRLRRDDAVRFAVRLALESGAFRGATHSKEAPAPRVAGRPRSACELVGQRLSDSGAGVALGYAAVKSIWEARPKS